MIVEGDVLLTKIVNQQFKILGLNKTFAEIPDSGMVDVGKKKEKWYNVYKFTEEQEKQWKEWALAELRKIHSDEKEIQGVFRELDLVYGFVRDYTKRKGELF